MPLQLLDPATWPAHPPGGEEPEDAKTRLAKIAPEVPRDATVVVIVGHDPQVSWLLHHLVKAGGRGQRCTGPLPLARGELVMLEGSLEKAELRWVLSPSDEEVIEQLQDKIKSKMDAAKLLGAFLTGLLFFAAKELAGVSTTAGWYPWVAGSGLVLLGMATAAYFVTMFLCPQTSSRQR